MKKLWKLFKKKEKFTPPIGLSNPTRLKFIIPLGNIDETKAKKFLAELMSNYKKDIDFSYFVRADRKQKIQKLYGTLESE